MGTRCCSCWRCHYTTTSCSTLCWTFKNLLLLIVLLQNHHHSTTLTPLYCSKIMSIYVLAFVYFKVVKRNRKKLVKLLSWKSVSPPLLLLYYCTTTTTRLFFLMSPTFFCIIFLHIVMKEKKSPLNTTLAILNIPWGWQ